MGDQAIANPFEAQPVSGGGQAIDNPFETAPAAQTAAPVDPYAGHKIDAGEKGFRGWLTDLESDIRSGGESTIIGKMLKKMGAQGINVGAQGNSTAGDTLLSPVLGPIKTAKGVVDAHVPGKGWQATKELVGGAMQTAELPSAFVAPEAGEAGAQAAEQVASKAGGAVSRGLQKVGLTASPEARAAVQTAKNPQTAALAERTAQEINESAIPELHAGVSKALDAVGVSAKNEISQTLGSVGGQMDEGAAKAIDTALSSGTLSEKADAIGNAMRSSAQQIYQKLDEMGGGGRFQRYSETIRTIEDELKNPALMGEPKIQLQQSLAKAQQEFSAFKDQMAAAGLDQKVIKMADKLWSKGASLDEWSRKLFRAEDLSGKLNASSKPLNNAVRDLTAKAAPRGHVLRNGLGDQADEVAGAVQKATDTIKAGRQATAQAKKIVRAGAKGQQELNKVTRNRAAVAGALGAGAAYKYGGAAKALFTDR